MSDNSNLVTHRCAERQQGFGIRYLNDRYYRGWYLMQDEFDWDWYTHMYLPVVKVNFCPFCGERLVQE